ncbi:nitrate/trimethylamine N-oxide reductase NapE/TorE [Pasteurella multocida]|nr:nitrate/trimethylamine N-oxide reductase NapE/TorE [Pasteurella multocida]AWW56262.1 nitrate/trimethylamine N-oxide reductase NapE/TorE [Pasteurella multocida]MDX3887726.1 nitrate/trimethylamine N-oxide reductase NapE/TorE [Pasteurella multocida]MDX3950291.1 nitrate/trimethylamine N-oxide reductase NapE/TorE [Pasteurella multocida]MDX3957192.1 nitrate/trimethylamine N-oxide reductase NapE/TorE [Pasteurella multocida]MDX3963532.1 nitrate/trimethylamine N-oxide reductase NapE/TorE [Pasteurell
MLRQQTHSTLKDVIKTFIPLPILMMGSVGAYGLIVWLLQMFVIGLPGA